MQHKKYQNNPFINLSNPLTALTDYAATIDETELGEPDEVPPEILDFSCDPNLPIYEYHNEIKDMIRDNKVTIITAVTGSGKVSFGIIFKAILN